MIEIGFTIGTIFEIILLPIVLFASVKRAYCLALFLTVFNRMAFLNIQGNSILVDQVFTLILIIRLLLCRLKIKFCLPKSLLFFVFYAGISIFFAPFYGDTYVISVDGIYSPVSFSIQQLTQYAYLLYAVFFMIITSNMLLMNKVTVDEILNVLDISYFIVIILGILQLFL